MIGPIEFCSYTIPLGAILRYHNMRNNIYADDTQIYSSFNIKCPNPDMDKITSCVSDIRTWMIKNKLKINYDKTEFLVITSVHARLTDEPVLSIGHEDIPPSKSCKSLGVIFDSHFSMESQANNMCCATPFHLRSISSVCHLLTDSATAQIVHSLITLRLDYCNSLLYGIPDCEIKKLQRV